MIDVYSVPGVFSYKPSVARDLANAVMRLGAGAADCTFLEEHRRVRSSKPTAAATRSCSSSLRSCHHEPKVSVYSTSHTQAV
jgi:hypothetical protein